MDWLRQDETRRVWEAVSEAVSEERRTSWDAGIEDWGGGLPSVDQSNPSLTAAKYLLASRQAKLPASAMAFMTDAIEWIYSIETLSPELNKKLEDAADLLNTLMGSDARPRAGSPIPTGRRYYCGYCHGYH